jgi:AcrR family transcriptional regulator
MSKTISTAPKLAGATREQQRDLKPGVVAYKRARILEEASLLFFERGYESATLEMLADRLSVTKPFLYTYFRNKSDILSAICELGVQESLHALDRVSQQGADSADRLRIALAEVAGIIIDRHEYIVVYQREMKNLDRADAQRIIRLRHEFDLRIGRLVEACQNDGLVAFEDAAAMSVWMGGLLSWITNCYRPGSRRSRDTIIKQVVHACMRLIGLG